MIRSWKNKSSRKLWEQQTASQFRGLDVSAAIDLLLALNISRSLDDLMPLQSAGLRRKKGHGHKRWMMAIDERWHIRFDSRTGDVVDVKLVGKESGKDGSNTADKRSTKAIGRKTDRSPNRSKGSVMTPAIHPGRFLKRELGARHLSASRLALDIGVPSGRITDILNARRAITADTAVRLGRYLGMSAQFWCDLQSQFDIAVVARKKGAEIGRRVRAAESA